MTTLQSFILVLLGLRSLSLGKVIYNVDLDTRRKQEKERKALRAKSMGIFTAGLLVFVLIYSAVEAFDAGVMVALLMLLMELLAALVYRTTGPASRI